MGQLRHQAVKCFSLGAILAPADQIAHILADVFVGTVLAHVGGDKVVEGAAEANRHGCGACPWHGVRLLAYVFNIIKLEYTSKRLTLEITKIEH